MSKLEPVQTRTPAVDRRRTPRLAPHTGILTTKLITEDGREFDADMQDISAGGIALSGNLPVRTGDTVKLEIALNQDVAPYEVRAHVVHRGDSRVGLRYVI